MFSYMYVPNIELDIHLISKANRASCINAGTIREKEAEAMFRQFSEKFPISGDLTITEVSFLVSRQAEWAVLVTNAYNNIIADCTAVFSVWNTETVKSCSSEAVQESDQVLRSIEEWHKKMVSFLDDTERELKSLHCCMNPVLNCG